MNKKQKKKFKSVDICTGRNLLLYGSKKVEIYVEKCNLDNVDKKQNDFLIETRRTIKKKFLKLKKKTINENETKNKNNFSSIFSRIKKILKKRNLINICAKNEHNSSIYFSLYYVEWIAAKSTEICEV